MAYADPPYPGLSKRYYAAHPDFGGEVDHRELLSRLACSYDGWALSTSARALPAVLPLALEAEPTREVRVAAWYRGSCAGKSSRPRPAWEPVLYCGGRDSHPIEMRCEDALSHWSRPRTTDRKRVIGAKPARFIYWMFDLLGAAPGDHFDDLFPGSGGVGRAWAIFEARAQ